MPDFPISRRRLLQGMAAGAGASMLPNLGSAWASPLPQRKGLILPPGSRPDPTKPEGVDLLPQVEHIVIYMQENHSYDNYFGMLGRGDGLTLGPDGLPTNTNPDLNGNPVGMTHTTTTCDTTPGASQSWNSSHIQFDGGAQDGFIKSADGAIGSMGYWDGTALPYYYGLANTFVVCDRWFCSVLGQTYPNRRFLQAATSVGIVSTDIQEIIATPSAPNGVIWDRLNDHGITWNDYAFDLPDILLFPDFHKNNTARIKTHNDFLLDCQNGTLPQVSIISPGFEKYTEEGSVDIQLGEAYSASVINAVINSPTWPKTALFFMYDEHGGFYDHVPPPAAVKPDDIAPRIVAGTDQPGDFDRYGMRVPAIIISPFAKANYVSSVVHDHTSVLKFIETKFNLGAMTYRDANADDLLDAFDFDAAAFLEPPALPAIGLPASGSTCQPDVPAPPTSPTAVTTTTTSTTTTTTTTAVPTTLPPSSSVPGSTVPGSTLPYDPGVLPADATAVTVANGTTGDGGSVTGVTTLARTGAPTSTLATAGGVAVFSGLVALAARAALKRDRDDEEPEPAG